VQAALRLDVVGGEHVPGLAEALGAHDLLEVRAHASQERRRARYVVHGPTVADEKAVLHNADIRSYPLPWQATHDARATSATGLSCRALSPPAVWHPEQRTPAAYIGSWMWSSRAAVPPWNSAAAAVAPTRNEGDPRWLGASVPVAPCAMSS
jgi:hypothetical protein